MGYSYSDNGGNSGPNVGGNSSSGNITVGGNPNVHAAIVSVQSIFQNPVTLGILALVALGALWIWKGAR
jgi:hypothetical protein